MGTNYGDAFNDMPEEYREYVDKIRAGDPSAIQYIYDCIDGKHENDASNKSEADKAIADGKLHWIKHHDMGWKLMVLVDKKHEVGVSLLGYNEWQSGVHQTEWMEERYVEEILPNGITPEEFKEQSEADKAIIDGKPRWMRHPELGWQYVIFTHREHHRSPTPLLCYREAIEKASGIHETPLMLVVTGVEILPYGKVPLAKPDRIPSFSCPDCGSSLENRLATGGIEGWCIECDVKVLDVGGRFSIPIEETEGYEEKMPPGHEGYFGMLADLMIFVESMTKEAKAYFWTHTNQLLNKSREFQIDYIRYLKSALQRAENISWADRLVKRGE